MEGDKRQERWPRKIKVFARTYKGRATRSRFDNSYEYPEVRLGGLWVRELGLEIGDVVEVVPNRAGILIRRAAKTTKKRAA